jgi:hypothetical protein
MNGFHTSKTDHRRDTENAENLLKGGRLVRFIRVAIIGVLLFGNSAWGQVAGDSGADDLMIAEGGVSKAVVAVSPLAGEWEKRAAGDLVTYIEKMSGARVEMANTAEGMAGALKATSPVIIVGRAALEAEPSLKDALAKVAKANPVLRADAIVVRRSGNRVYVAGLNDDCQYYAVADLLRRWGCRWFLPGVFGECFPHYGAIKIGAID